LNNRYNMGKLFKIFWNVLYYVRKSLPEGKAITCSEQGSYNKANLSVCLTKYYALKTFFILK